MKRGGVSLYRGGKWRVDDRAGTFIGLFDTKEAAEIAFGKAERIRCGFEKPKAEK